MDSLEPKVIRLNFVDLVPNAQPWTNAAFIPRLESEWPAGVVCMEFFLLGASRGTCF